jgi:imidazolonepropionase
MEDGLIVNARIATMAGGRYATIDNGALLARAGRIAWVGPMDAFARERPAQGDVDPVDAHGALVTPGLVDCHTHLVYAGNRAQEFERRLQGATYEEIAREGGGILSTVRATRAASPAQLAKDTSARVEALGAGGVTTVEIKSGYGLDLENEMKCLRVARALEGMRVVTTFLGAHALPPEFSGRADAYIDLVCREMIPAIAREKLADAVDAFCEGIGFTSAQTRRVFEAARAHGLRVKLHAEQLSNLHGAALAAEFGALSADHLEHADEAGIAAMAKAGTVAVLLPGAFYFLRETRVPPIELLRKHRVPMAVATDCNPGTSPITSLPTVMGMACTFFRLTPEEALAGATCHAARALGLDDRGVLAPGNLADVVMWDAAAPAEISYSVGVPRAKRI